MQRPPCAGSFEKQWPFGRAVCGDLSSSPQACRMLAGSKNKRWRRRVPMPGGSLLCVECAAPVQHLYKEYSKGSIRLTRCVICMRPVSQSSIVEDCGDASGSSVGLLDLHQQPRHAAVGVHDAKELAMGILDGQRGLALLRQCLRWVFRDAVAILVRWALRSRHNALPHNGRETIGHTISLNYYTTCASGAAVAAALPPPFSRSSVMVVCISSKRFANCSSATLPPRATTALSALSARST
jgi:hypothetical protein